MQEYIYEKDGRKRKATRIICDNCGTEFLKSNKAIKRSKNNYCSIVCAHEGSRNQIEVVCDYCGNLFTKAPNKFKRSKHGFNFCSRKCKDFSQRLDSGDKFNKLRPKHYGNGLSNYQDRAYEFYGELCNRCGYNKNKTALQVHHIDGNRENNSIKNLEVLCANCHAIETWG